MFIFSFAHNSFAFHMHIRGRIDFLQTAVNVLDDIIFSLEFPTLNDITISDLERHLKIATREINWF